MQLSTLVGSSSNSALHVHWFEDWHDDLGAALAVLPTMDTCPTELYTELLLTRGEAAKRIGLVLNRDVPVAVVGLRQDGARWTPITSWVVPGALFPVAAGFETDVLGRLGLPLYIAWWRQPGPPPQSSIFENVKAVPTRRLTCSGDYEGYWKESGWLKQISAARRKCQSLRVAVNVEGAAEWTLLNWGKRWAQPGAAEVIDTRDRLAVARYWQPRGRQFTVSLMDGDAFAASAVVFAHGKDVVGQANFRVSAYDKLSVGTRLLDAVQQWAAQAGFEKHDFGGGHDYKAAWAPEEGMRWELEVNPKGSTLARWARGLLGKESLRP